MQAGGAAPGPTVGVLAGRVVLVTGCCGGLGRAVSRLAAGAGATVVLLGRRVPALERLYDELRTSGAPEPALYPLDLAGASPEDFEQLAVAIRSGCGRLDGIVHAAARFEGLAPLLLTDPVAWLATLHVNLGAPVVLTRACLSLLSEGGDGSVVFVLDDPERVGNANWGAYGVAKSALPALVRQLDQECEHAGVRVHGLLPGPMRTPLRANAYAAEDPSRWPTPEATAERAVYLLGAAAAAERGLVLDARGTGARPA